MKAAGITAPLVIRKEYAPIAQRDTLRITENASLLINAPRDLTSKIINVFLVSTTVNPVQTLRIVTLVKKVSSSNITILGGLLNGTFGVINAQITVPNVDSMENVSTVTRLSLWIKMEFVSLKLIFVKEESSIIEKTETVKLA